MLVTIQSVSTPWWEGYFGACGYCCPQIGQGWSIGKGSWQRSIYDFFDVVSLSHSDHDDLCYALDDGSEVPLSIGHKEMLKTLKLFTAHKVSEGHPIDNWIQVTKNTLMTSGPLTHVFLPLKGRTTSCSPLHLLSLRRKISSLTSRRESREMLLCSVFWRIPNSGTHGIAPLWLAQAWAHAISEVLNPLFKPPIREKTFLKPSKSIYMLSSKEYCRQTKGKPWWDHMKPQLMSKISIMSYANMLSDLLVLPLILHGSFPISLLWGLEMVIGMDHPYPSLARAGLTVWITCWYGSPLWFWAKDAYAWEGGPPLAKSVASQELSQLAPPGIVSWQDHEVWVMLQPTAFSCIKLQCPLCHQRKTWFHHFQDTKMFMHMTQLTMEMVTSMTPLT